MLAKRRAVKWPLPSSSRKQDSLSINQTALESTGGLVTTEFYRRTKKDRFCHRIQDIELGGVRHLILSSQLFHVSRLPPPSASG